MREVVLDTETTGLDHTAGHRVVEIGCVELANHVPTGRSWSTYLNPGRDSEEAALVVHGLTAAFLARQPSFRDKAEEFLEFLADSRLVIHNAEFDLGFSTASLNDAVSARSIPTARSTPWPWRGGSFPANRTVSMP